MPGLPVSRALLKIVRALPGAGGPPPAAQQHAGEALVARKDRAAAPLLLEALAEHYDFLDDKQPRGVDVLARALAALDVKEAAPLLAAHLADHETPERALKDIAQALAQLGRPRGGATRCASSCSSTTPIRRSSSIRRRSTPRARRWSTPAVEARRTVAFVVEDKRTLQPVARQLRVALDEAMAKEKEAAEKKEDQDDGQAAPEKQE